MCAAAGADHTHRTDRGPEPGPPHRPVREQPRGRPAREAGHRNRSKRKTARARCSAAGSHGRSCSGRRREMVARADAARSFRSSASGWSDQKSVGTVVPHVPTGRRRDRAARVEWPPGQVRGRRPRRATPRCSARARLVRQAAPFTRMAKAPAVTSVAAIVTRFARRGSASRQPRRAPRRAGGSARRRRDRPPTSPTGSRRRPRTCWESWRWRRPAPMPRNASAPRVAAGSVNRPARNSHAPSAASGNGAATQRLKLKTSEPISRGTNASGRKS